MQPQSAQDLVNMGFYGYNGWGNAEALADYRATGGQGKGAATNTGAINNTTSTSTSSGGGYSTGQAAADIKSQYSNLLGLLRGQTDTATASEYGKRGIPVSSGIVQNAQNQNYNNAAAQVQLNESRDLAGLASDPTLASSLSSKTGSGSSGGSGASTPTTDLGSIWDSLQNPNSSGLAQQTQSTPGVQRLADGSPALLGIAQYPAGQIPVAAQPSYVNGVNANPSSSQLSNLRAQPTVTNSGGEDATQRLLRLLGIGSGIALNGGNVNSFLNYRPY